jgi:hypothetical protein
MAVQPPGKIKKLVPSVSKRSVNGLPIYAPFAARVRHVLRKIFLEVKDKVGSTKWKPAQIEAKGNSTSDV